MESGQVVCGKYKLHQVLGAGGMAEVWSATNTFTERQIAIKFLSREVAKTPEAAGRFLKEAKVTARINHPNVIEIHDVGQTEDGQLFLVMELLNGFPLEVALKRQEPRMTMYDLALTMLEVAQALAAAHQSGIIHRDLKPTNIFLHRLRDGVAVPKLLDFGVSKFLDDDKNHALTVDGTVLGSPLYMSPEQARGENDLDGRTDVFAFGAILFEALCGYRAYEAKNFNALIVKIATTSPRAIDECAPELPESLRSVVRACMAFDPEDRPASFEVVVAMLRAALPELDMSPLRLPSPRVAADPDATNAIPLGRSSERLPGSSRPAGSLSATYPPGSIPYGNSGASGASWLTPNTSYASIHAPPAAPARRAPNTFALVGVGLALLVLGTAVGVRVGPSQAPRPTAAQPAPPSAAQELPPPATKPAAKSEPPSVSVDALPLASASAAPSARKPR